MDGMSLESDKTLLSQDSEPQQTPGHGTEEEEGEREAKQNNNRNNSQYLDKQSSSLEPKIQIINLYENQMMPPFNSILMPQVFSYRCFCGPD